MIRPSNMASRASTHAASSAYESHPSLAVSMEDFEAHEFSPTVPDLPSQHSIYRSGVSSYQSETSSTRRSASPPAWRKAGSGWFKHQGSLSPSRQGYHSREGSLGYRSADDEGDGDEGEVTVPSPSPTPFFGGGEAVRASTAVNERPSTPPRQGVESEAPDQKTPTQMNYIRFSTSLDVIQRTEPIEAAVTWARKVTHHATKSRHNLLLYTLGSLFFYWLASNLLSTPINTPAPDLVKVAGLAKSFEPVIFYSEHGHAQIEELHDTGVAVWDLGESVRSTNMTSGPIIVHQLDDLSDSMKTLAIEMTRFFASVDADVDSILLVMEWAQRELTAISTAPPSAISSIWSNAHGLLTRIGLMKDTPLLRDLLGHTHAQRTKATLDRTFHEFLGVLEESINNELSHSIALFGLFEAIDKQFLNLQRTVIREQDQQERLENDFLSSLWTKVIGVNASLLRKYQKNKDLLASVRDRTVRNKHVLVDHNQRLLQLKSNLEILRRKLVSPLVRSENGSTLSVEEQVRGLEGTYSLLKGTREVQKRKMMEIVYGSGSRRGGIEGEGRAIEG
ncbi:hypothetical protein WHR41_02572 [Cladosporium halotolerans]|uniref:Uncharacterized protein n=1 Tax=Cladosporium halotolerans TaxID=1052096 RepID=A0AB34KWY7_9PEZI